jgi:hypothetical protein
VIQIREKRSDDLAAVRNSNRRASGEHQEKQHRGRIEGQRAFHEFFERILGFESDADSRARFGVMLALLTN